MARTREALLNGWDKNDPTDAQVMLHMMWIGATQVYQDPIGAGINDIQKLSKTHEIVLKAKIELWHRILTHYSKPTTEAKFAETRAEIDDVRRTRRRAFE